MHALPERGRRYQAGQVLGLAGVLERGEGSGEPFGMCWLQAASDTGGGFEETPRRKFRIHEVREFR